MANDTTPPQHKPMRTIALALTAASGLSLPALAQENFLVMNDFHLNANQQHAMQIDPAGYNPANNLDPSRLSTMIQKIAAHTGSGRLISQPDFILILGDLVDANSQAAHNNSFNRQEHVYQNEYTVYQTIREHFPDTPIINVFGNKDSFKQDYGPFQYQKQSPLTVAEAAGFTNGFLSNGKHCYQKEPTFPCLSHENRRYGYFSIKLKPGLTLIGLNSVMFSQHYQAEDAHQAQSRQLHFLGRALSKAGSESNGIIIAMHIPSGTNMFNGERFWKPQLNRKFNELLRKHFPVIRGILVAHTHMDEFNVLQYHNKVLGQYYIPGMSTSHGNSPGLRSFHLHHTPAGWFIDNYTTYGFHNTLQTDRDSAGIKLEKSYSFVSTFCQRPGKAIIDINTCLHNLKPAALSKHIKVDNPDNPSPQINYPQYFRINPNTNRKSP